VGTASETDVTAVPQSPVDDQGVVGNCWIHFTLGTAEALARLGDRTSQVVFSRAYLSYWHWFWQIAYQRFSPFSANDLGRLPTLRQVICRATSILFEGGTFSLARDLIAAHGLMREGDFLSTSEPESKALETIWSKVNVELQSGGRLFFPSNQTPDQVRQVLNEVFGLDESTIAEMSRLFPSGKEGKSLARSSGNFLSAHDTMVGYRTPENATVSAPLINVLDRYEFVAAPPTDDQRGRRRLLQRMQRALFNEQPVVLSFGINTDYVNDSKRNSFRLENYTGNHHETSRLPREGFHGLVLDDFEIDAPPFGRLHAGQLVTDPAQKAAALADTAEIIFLRGKNSWGYTPAPGTAAPRDLRGYWDIYLNYLNIETAPPARDDTSAETSSTCEQPWPTGPFWQNVFLPREY